MAEDSGQISLYLVMDGGKNIAGFPGEQVTDIVKRGFVLPDGRPRGKMPLMLVPRVCGDDLVLDVHVTTPPTRAFMKRGEVRSVLLPDGRKATPEEIRELL